MTHDREWCPQHFGEFEIVETDERNFRRDAQLVRVQRADELDGRDSLDCECGGGPVFRGRGCSSPASDKRLHGLVGRDVCSEDGTEAGGAHCGFVSFNSFADGVATGVEANACDLLVAMPDEVADAELGALAVFN